MSAPGIGRPSATGPDVDAYLARTVAAREDPSLGALDRLISAHARTFTFDNIDVLLDQHPGVSPAATWAKFVGRGRGGYCFEHSTLFHTVLTALGYDASLRLGRVGDPQAAPRTHLSIVVTFDGTPHLVDVGIGVPALGAIPLIDGAVLAGPIWDHQIRAVSEGAGGPAWQLWRERAAGWEHMHTVDELPVRPVDVAMGHHWTSTAPLSHFRTSFTLGRHGTDADGTPTQTTVTLDGVTDRRQGSRSEHRPLNLDELPGLLDRLGTRVTEAETTRLHGRLSELLAGRTAAATPGPLARPAPSSDHRGTAR